MYNACIMHLPVSYLKFFMAHFFLLTVHVNSRKHACGILVNHPYLSVACMSVCAYICACKCTFAHSFVRVYVCGRMYEWMCVRNG